MGDKEIELDNIKNIHKNENDSDNRNANLSTTYNEIEIDSTREPHSTDNNDIFTNDESYITTTYNHNIKKYVSSPSLTTLNREENNNYPKPIEIKSPKSQIINMRCADNNINDKNDRKIKNPINDWDNDANDTLKDWYYAFKELSHSYQFILDRNYKMSSTLSMISICSSSVLSIFSGFKLWLQDDKIFQNSSDIFMMISNFAIAGMTTMAKRYLDDNRNEKMRIYIDEVDQFLNLIYAQFCLKPVYRINAKTFFKNNNDKYTRLMVSAPNLSIKEMLLAKKNYLIYKKNFETNN